MKYRLARFLLILFLLQSTELGEFLKFPLLLQHYGQHVRLHPGTTVIGFLKMHYFDKTVVDEDYAQDMQLPFKTLDNHNLTIQLSMPPVAVAIACLHPFHLEPKIVYYSAFVPHTFSGKVFQPPKPA
ncbi:hypothetical protein [uncultured Mucilaginibacter sp.]|uniref:hypothetical protein n=1 Tax=uncultured Mucilaginibacter sp. TaxID=797541 RepID=UPI00263281FB|nr:hypothetical protein [uncultured Mucilaginibacter sp.]